MQEKFENYYIVFKQVPFLFAFKQNIDCRPVMVKVCPTQLPTNVEQTSFVPFLHIHMESLFVKPVLRQQIDVQFFSNVCIMKSGKEIRWIAMHVLFVLVECVVKRLKGFRRTQRHWYIVMQVLPCGDAG